MKSKVLVSSILTIALCLSLIAGSTFALFTDSSKFNIAVTSGDVEIKAWASIPTLWSAEGPVSEHDDKYLKDEYGSYYEHKVQTDFFKNGGTAYIDTNDGTVVVDRITPGDKFAVTINATNYSDVALRYRYTIKVLEDGGLATGMVLTTHDGQTEYEAIKSFTSEWFPVVEAGDGIPEKTVYLELPVYAGNEYQSEHKGNQYYDAAGKEKAYDDDDFKTVKYQVLVEAVQGNAVVSDTETTAEVYPIASAIDLAFANNDGVVKIAGSEHVDIPETLYADGEVTVSGAVLDGSAKKDPAVLFVGGNDEVRDTTIVLENGAKIIATATNDVYEYDTAICALLDDDDVFTLSLDETSTIVADGNNGVGVFVQFGQANITLKGDDSRIVATNGAATFVFCETVVNIYVDDAAYIAQYESDIWTDGSATINWYVGDTLVKTGDSYNVF
jgi:predicted ribosomally synthesized peptide with SipW-like signal peptide